MTAAQHSRLGCMCLMFWIKGKAESLNDTERFTPNMRYPVAGKSSNIAAPHNEVGIRICCGNLALLDVLPDSM